MTTVKELINYLQSEDQDAPVLYQYYLPEHTDVPNEMVEDVFREAQDRIIEGAANDLFDDLIYYAQEYCEEREAA